jgi:hypothetical protein
MRAPGSNQRIRLLPSLRSRASIVTGTDIFLIDHQRAMQASSLKDSDPLWAALQGVCLTHADIRDIMRRRAQRAALSLPVGLGPG